MSLRDPVIQRATCLEDILPLNDKNFASQVASEILKLKGIWSAFLCDGFDEFTPSHPNSFIEQLINNPAAVNLGKCAILITSRPVASGELRKKVQSRIEILDCIEKTTFLIVTL